MTCSLFSFHFTTHQAPVDHCLMVAVRCASLIKRFLANQNLFRRLPVQAFSAGQLIAMADKFSLNLTRVLISDAVDPKCVQILKENGIAVEYNTKLTKEQLLAEIPKYDGLVVRSATKVSADVIKAGKNLKVIGRAGTGVDNIDCVAATRNGIIVMNTPGGNTLSAAEHTCALIIALSRSLPQAMASLKAGKWDRKTFMGNELYGKTLVIVGLGRIGKEVAIRMQSFGMKTVGYDPIIPAEVTREFGVEQNSLELLWPIADYITVHTPLIPETTNLINKDVFSKCKKGVKIVNCARGGIICEDSLLDALNSGQCAGTGLDVFLEEPPKNRALIEHPNTICTPHLGANTIEAQSRVATEIAEQFVDMVNGRSLFGTINAEALIHVLNPQTLPWITCGQVLGTLLASIHGHCKSANVNLQTFGCCLANSHNYLRIAVLCGFLKYDGQNNANLINALELAKENEINVSSVHNASGPNNLPTGLTISTEINGVSHQITGSVIGTSVVLHEIDGNWFPAGILVKGNLILYKSKPESSVQMAGLLNSQGCQVNLQAFSTPTGDGDVWAIVNCQKFPSVKESLKSVATFMTTVTI